MKDGGKDSTSHIENALPQPQWDRLRKCSLPDILEKMGEVLPRLKRELQLEALLPDVVKTTGFDEPYFHNLVLDMYSIFAFTQVITAIVFPQIDNASESLAKRTRTNFADTSDLSGDQAEFLAWLTTDNIGIFRVIELNPGWVESMMARLVRRDLDAMYELFFIYAHELFHAAQVIGAPDSYRKTLMASRYHNRPVLHILYAADIGEHGANTYPTNFLRQLENLFSRSDWKMNNIPISTKLKDFITHGISVNWRLASRISAVWKRMNQDGVISASDVALNKLADRNYGSRREKPDLNDQGH